MSKETTELMIALSECPECFSEINISWSPCYDFECCGIDDSIACDRCNWEVEGYFQEIDFKEFRHYVPKNIDDLKSTVNRMFLEIRNRDDELRTLKLSTIELKDRIKRLQDLTQRLQSEIRAYESKDSL